MLHARKHITNVTPAEPPLMLHARNTSLMLHARNTALILHARNTSLILYARGLGG